MEPITAVVTAASTVYNIGKSIFGGGSGSGMVGGITQEQRQAAIQAEKNIDTWMNEQFGLDYQNDLRNVSSAEERRNCKLKKTFDEQKECITSILLRAGLINQNQGKIQIASSAEKFIVNNSNQILYVGIGIGAILLLKYLKILKF